METLTLEIPAEVARAIRLPPQETPQRLRLELAVALYAQALLSVGKAAELAGIDRIRFDEELFRRHVPMQYDASDLAQDVAYARSGM
jgi:predicted HTH domain antitoxin